MKKRKAPLLELPLEVEDDVFEASGAALRLAAEMGFGRLESNLIATAVSEISMNVIRYGERGVISISRTSNNKGLSIRISDEGPGISDPELALSDGYTTSKASLGLGMGAARRAMDTFDLQSRPGKGTTIRMEKYMPVPAGLVEPCVISVPDESYDINGDSYVIREFRGDRVLLAVIDGLGQGANAYESSLLARNVIESHHFLPLDDILYACEAALRERGGNFGAAIGLLLIKPRSFEYAGVGDTFIKVLTGAGRQPVSQAGLIGPFRMPLVKVKKITSQRKNMVVALCTDGIKEHFSGEDLPVDADVRIIASEIMEKHRRSYGDATVMVVRFNIS